MNLPVSSTSDYLHHYFMETQLRFAGFLSLYRDNILNNRDARVAAAKGEKFVPKHHSFIDMKSKRVYASNDRYDFQSTNR
ncbi:hypothetical protein [Eupransor demetentiae]|uniref:Uncharacterized protein n=1 Tax=Eupransor demetentiae TaxID=3109584 RepID=A0ABP0ENY9_9LACO|nr:hypothetical protein R54876_GBNLAHCA_00375 [Lactobacillaceae bacterium LMG 33000]